MELLLLVLMADRSRSAALRLSAVHFKQLPSLSARLNRPCAGAGVPQALCTRAEACGRRSGGVGVSVGGEARRGVGQSAAAARQTPLLLLCCMPFV
jgi:hypothetical protein